MSKRLCAGLLAAALALAAGADTASASGTAEEWTPEQRKLLQNTLSLNELQRDVERIAGEQEQLSRQRERLNEEIKRLEGRIADSRERTGTIVRTQYMQSQRPMLLSLLNARSFGELTRLYTYYRLAVRHDEEVLLAFRRDTDDLRSRRDDLAANALRLEDIKLGIENQQRRLRALQEDIDAGLLASDDPASLGRLAEELNVYWNNVGLYEVDEYFSSLAAASNKLPDFLQSSGKMQVSGLGTRYTIELTDGELNDFLRSQSSDFENFAFTFEDGRVVAEGQQGRLTLRIEGRYTLEAEPDNAILFHVDKLVFNGLELPESTRKELEQKYDLGFYPQQVAPVEVSSVETANGRLKISLRLTL
ncbi:coiled-coil domain-containing protein [Saccharibacillus alkalitolerans]|uniref:SbsC C-terminal domain-containing protein n=1 Tax=Saccharibacillus alkalitolerans TaxID=2705290 RepID=A0ABX0F1Q7_9BACL|nr:hypothetical protein [Saccharibacillus alkalitolerans]NGZ73864.1 hypothetical protein [Saccharibacillus alkalitolerans]